MGQPEGERIIVLVLKTSVVFEPIEWIESYLEVGAKLEWSLLIPDLFFVLSGIGTKVAREFTSASESFASPDHTHFAGEIAIGGI